MDVVVLKVSYFLANVFAFDRFKRYFSEATYEKLFTKKVFLKSHIKTIKTYCFCSSMVKIELRKLFGDNRYEGIQIYSIKDCRPAHFQHVSMPLRRDLLFLTLLKSSHKKCHLQWSIHFIIYLIYHFYVFVLYKKRCLYFTFSFFQVNCSGLCSNMKFSFHAMESMAIYH